MDSNITNDYYQILSHLKERIKNARQQASIILNTELFLLYWEIGNTIHKQETNAGWGAKIIDTLAKDLRLEFSDMKGLSERNLRYMRNFSIEYPLFPILQTTSAKLQTIDIEKDTILQTNSAKLERNPKVEDILGRLSWSHHTTLLDKVKDEQIRAFYIQKAVECGWTRDMMVNQIESGLHNRQGALTHNFKQTLPDYQSELTQQLFKDPYQLDFIMLSNQAKERDLEDALMTHITNLLLELGDGFAFMGRQKKFTIGNREFFIDLLFYHTKLRRHVIIELKIGEFEAEFVSKMNLHLGLADDTLKGEFDEPAIGLILCKTKDKIVAEYALRDTHKPIGIAEYKIAEILPDDIKGELPSIEDIEDKLDKELKENVTPIDKRLQAVKERIKALANDEIQTPYSDELIKKIFEQELTPLYTIIIEKLSVFTNDFLNIVYLWHTDKKNNLTLEQISEIWEDSENDTEIKSLTFSYRMLNFKKSGTEDLSEYIDLKIEFNRYWYGFSIPNYNNHQPFLKKLYHQQLSNADVNIIIDLIMTQVLDKIEWFFERINEKKV